MVTNSTETMDRILDQGSLLEYPLHKAYRVSVTGTADCLWRSRNNVCLGVR